MSLFTKKLAKALGKRGGQATLKKYGPEHFKKLRKLSSGRTIAKNNKKKDTT